MMQALDLLAAARAAFPEAVTCLLLDEHTPTQLVLSLRDRATHIPENYKLDVADFDRPAADVIAEIMAMRAPTKQDR